MARTSVSTVKNTTTTLLLLLLATASSLAVAGDSTATAAAAAFAPPATDVSVGYLSQIFGGVVSEIQGAASLGAGAPDSGLGAMMGVFNAAVMMIGMWFVGYLSVKGVLDTAHDGVVLGKKMSNIWTPIRTAAGTGLLLPLSGGFSLLQKIVLWLALSGVGVADHMWDAFIGHVQMGGSMAPVSVPDARPLAASILRSEACMYAWNKNLQEGGSQDKPVTLQKSTQTLSNGGEAGGMTAPGMAAADANSIYVQTTYSWTDGSFLSGAPTCGGVSWQESQQSSIGGGDALAAKGPILSAQAQAVQGLIAELAPVAQSIAEKQVAPQPGVLETAAAHYQARVAAAAQAAITNGPERVQQAFLSGAKDGGWVFAGAYMSQLLRLQDSIQQAANTLPSSVPLGLSPEATEMMKYFPSWSETMAVVDEFSKNRSAAPAQSVTDTNIEASQLRSADDVWRLLSRPVMAGVNHTTQLIAGNNTSPLLQLRAMGNELLNVGYAVKAVQFAIVGAANSNAAGITINNVFNIGEALKTIYPVITLLTSGLWLAGLGLAFVIPSLGFIYWVTSIARWLATVAEAVIAAPLMAVFLIHPDGHETAGKAASGFMLILALVMQPASLLLAFVISMSAMYPIEAGVNWTYTTMFSGVVGSSFAGLATYIAGILVYTVLMTLAVQTSLGLLNSVPDNVMRYVGSAAGGQGLGQGADQAHRSMVGAVHSAGHAGAVNPAQGGGDKGRQGGSSPNEASGVSALGNSVSNADLIPQGRD